MEQIEGMKLSAGEVTFLLTLYPSDIQQTVEPLVVSQRLGIEG